MERAEQMKASRQAEDDMLAALLHHKKAVEEKVADESHASVTKSNNTLNMEKIKLVVALVKREEKRAERVLEVFTTCNNAKLKAERIKSSSPDKEEEAN